MVFKRGILTVVRHYIISTYNYITTMDCFLFPPLLEVFQQGTWLQLQDLEDPELAEIAKQLPSMVLSSRAHSSAKKYLGAFKRWKTWTKAHKLPTFPAESCHIALYLQHIGNQAKSKSAAEEAVNALKACLHDKNNAH